MAPSVETRSLAEELRSERRVLLMHARPAVPMPGALARSEGAPGGS